MKERFLLLLFLLSLTAFSQDLSFRNDFEEKAFASLESEEPDFMALMLAADGLATEQVLIEANTIIEKLIQDLNPQKFEKYSASKKIKKVFSIVQEQLLGKYELQNQFSDVFRTGSFNCVSATAIYAICLERFDIAYEIVEQPSHVYLIALPQDEAIVIESTDPTGGYLKLTEGLVLDQLNTLVALKVITAEELDSPDLGNILDELFPSESIDFRRLVAIQYHNQSVYDLEEENYEASYQNALKAEYIASNPRFKAMMYMALSGDLVKRDFESEDYINKLAAFTKLDTTREHKATVVDEFNLFMYHNLIEKPDLTKAGSAYAKLIDGLNDTLLKDDLRLVFLQYKCDYLLKMGDYRASLPVALQAMELRPENLDVISLVNMSVAGSVEAGYLKNPVDSLRSYMTSFPSLAGNKLWLSTYCNAILMDVFERVKVDKVSSIMPALKEFERIMDADADIPVILANVGVTYSRVALKQFNYSKSAAKATVNKGLGYAPSNPDLLRMKRAIQ